MNQDFRRREDYRENQSTRSLSRNQAFAAADNAVKPASVKRIIALIAVILVCFATAWTAHLYFSFNSVFGNGGQNTATSPKIAQKKPISVLILGVDQGIEGRHDRGNSDTLILATLNPDENKATMTSIPRDTLADIQGADDGKENIFKINSAYEVGGNKASVKTVSSLLNVPIDYYVEVNMKALKSLVDAVGGVDVQVPFNFTYDWCDFRKGKQHLNGRHAVAYVRMRHDDPKGDYGRQLRQRQVIEAVAKKAMSVNTLSNYKKLTKIFDKYVKTNLTFGDMISLAMNYRGCAGNLKSNYIQGHDAWIDGASIQVAPTKELQSKSNMIRKNLDLVPATLNNEETRQNKLNTINNNINWSNPDAFTNYQIFDKDSNGEASSSVNTQSQTNDSGENWFGKIFK